jgi:beta-lactam-binding protein with PASTA domain
VFRQKPWLPWWMAIVVPLLAALAVFLFLFLPKNVEVPDVIGKKSAFAAEQAVTEAKLVLAPETEKKVDTRVPPGTVLEQTPPAGKKAKEGEVVSILVATGDGKVDVPALTGQTPGEAEKTLREAGLTLGQTTPQPLDPKATVKSQIPAEKEIIAEGAPVDVFLTIPGTEKNGKNGGGGAAVAAGGADDGGADDGGAGGGGGAGGPIVIPAVDGATQTAYGHKIADLKLTPEVQSDFDESPKGTVFRVDPEPGKEAQAGDEVTLFVSAGSPALAYDNDKDVLLVDTAKSKPLKPIATGSETEKDPAWSADGSLIAYTSDGRVFLSDRTKPDEPAKALTPPGKNYSDLAFAPTGRDVLAMVEGTVGATPAEDTADLCLGRIVDGKLDPACKVEPDVIIGREIHWSDDGKEILASGFRVAQPGEFGIVQWTTKKPFSTNPDDWSAGRMRTDTSRPGQGVLDAAVSPNGKRMAVARIGKSGRPELVMAKRGDFALADAQRLKVAACKVIWRPDGERLVVVQSDDCFGAATGELLQFPADDPQSLRSLNLAGDNPVFQPLSTAG